MSFINAESIKVFISYSHDSPEHLESVLMLSDRLRRDGINCIIDQYEMSPREGWPRWTASQIEEARFVLVVCTEVYHSRVRGKEEIGKGLGAKWEGAIINQELYDSEANNDKFIPVLFSSEDSTHIPMYLRGATRYVLDDDFEDLYRRLTNQPKRLKPEMGARRSLPPLDRKEDFLPARESRATGQPASIDDTNPGAGESSNLLSGDDEPSNPDSYEEPPAERRNLRNIQLASWIVGALLVVLVVILLSWFRLLAPVKPGLDPPRKSDPDPVGISNSAPTNSPNPGPDLKGDSNSGSRNPSNPGAGGSPVKPPTIDIYRVRATVLDPEGTLIDDVEIYSSPSGEVKKVSGGWEIDIPAANKPMNGKVTIYASKASAFLREQLILQLGNNANPTVEIRLRSEPSARVSGWVKDSSGQGIPGALAYACEHREEAVRTGPDGKFDLMAHKAKGQIVMVCAEKEGYITEKQNHPAGTIPMTITLPRGQ